MNVNAVKPQDLKEIRDILRKKDVEFAFVGGAAWLENMEKAGKTFSINSDVDIFLVKGSINEIEATFGESSERHYLGRGPIPLSHDKRGKPSPFEVFSFEKAGIDVFTLGTGIGPISIEENGLVKKDGEYMLKPSTLIATYVNPLVIADERIQRAATIIFSLSNDELEQVAKDSHALVLKSAERVSNAALGDKKLRREPEFKDYLEVYIGKTPRRIEILSKKLVRIAGNMGFEDVEENEEKLKKYIRTFDAL